MKYIIKVVVVAFLLGGILYAQDKSEPKIKFEKTAHSFDTVRANTDLTFVFKFTNVGDDTLKILKVRPG